MVSLLPDPRCDSDVCQSFSEVIRHAWNSSWASSTIFFLGFSGLAGSWESEAEVLGREQQARNVRLRANTPQAFSLASVEISQQNGLPYWYFGCCIQLFSISLWLWQRNVSDHRSKYCLLAEDLQAQTSHYRPSADSHLSPGSSSVALPYGEDREDLWDHILKHCSGDFFDVYERSKIRSPSIRSLNKTRCSPHLDFTLFSVIRS